MQSTTFEDYKAAQHLQTQARITMSRLELLADHGIGRAEKLLNAAWDRYNRRTYKTNEAAQRHWGWRA